MMSIAQKDLLKEKLDQLQCHFTWGPQKENIDLDDMKQRLQDLMQAGVKYQAMPHNHLAFVNCLQGNCEEAIQNLKEAEKILRENHEHEFERRSIITYGNYAWVYYHMGQLTEAQSNLAKLEMICKRFTNGSRYTALIPEVYGEKGWSLLSSASQYYEEAKECFEKAQEEDLDDTDWNAGYATALFRLEGFSGTPESGEHSQSVKQLRHVLDLDTDDSVAMVLLALKLQEFNHKEEALKLVEQALQKSPDLTYVTRYAATFYRMKGDVEKAVELLKKALEITTNSTFFHHQIGQRYRKNLFQLNNNPGSKKTHNPAFQRKAELINKCKYHFEKAFEHRPLTSIQPQLDFARICSLNSEYPKPEVIYSNLLKLENIRPENKQAICLQAGLFELNHKRSESKAITHFLEGMKVKYDSIERTKCRKNLEMLAERRLCKNSRDSEAFRVLGFLHQLDGEKCEAIECFERALEFDRDNEEYRHSLCELRLSVKATLTFPTKTKHLKDALILSDL